MAIQTVGILSPGDMGHAIAAVLSQNGLHVVAALDDRSDRTRHLAATAHIHDVGSLQNLVAESDIVLSIVVPAAAISVAEQVAIAIRSSAKPLLYVDCNAISPQHVQQIGQVIQDVGGRCVDASIIGPPPRVPNQTRIYASGEFANEIAPLQAYGLDIRLISQEIGQASGLKMCSPALTKGLTAIGTELLVAAHRAGLDGVLADELAESQKELLARLISAIPAMIPKAHRWIGEMEEIASTFGQLGLPEQTFQGAADVYRWVQTTNTFNPETQGDCSQILNQIMIKLANAKR